MQAIILAAGMGKRLGAYTKDGTKCMVYVNDRTLIEYSLESLIAVGIRKVIIVVGYRAEKLQNFLKDKYPKLELIYVLNPIYDKTNNIYSLYLAADYFIQDDTILLESDLIYEPQIIKEIISHKDKNLAVVSKFESWMDGTVVLINNDHEITGILDKHNFLWNDIDKYYKTVNIYKFSTEFIRKQYLPFLKAYQEVFGQNEYYEQVLKVLTFLDNTSLKAYPVSGDRWYEIDDAQDLSIAEIRFAESTHKLHLMQNRYGGYWRFPQMLDYCYLVNPYFPNKKLLYELTSNFTELITQYPSGSRIQSFLAGKIFGIEEDAIIVGNGAAELIAALTENIAGTVVIPSPTFNEYPERLKNADIIRMNTDKQQAFRYTSADIIKTVQNISKKITAVILINPDNPSGNFISKEEMLSLLEELNKRHIMLIFDESFIDFADEDLRYTFLDANLLEKYPNLAVIKSISKSYGVPGLRLGIIASGNRTLIQEIRKKIPIWNINSFAEYFMQIFDKYKSIYIDACNKIACERNRFISELVKLPGLKVYPSQANYLLCKLMGTISSKELTEKLLKNDAVFIKDLSSKQGFENEQFIRLAIRNETDNRQLYLCLNKYLENGPNK